MSDARELGVSLDARLAPVGDVHVVDEVISEKSDRSSGF
jgi:hypothetical protein